jgi:methionine-gamma-lyase
VKDIKNLDIHTKVIHAGQHPDPAYGGISVPIYQSSTFVFKDAAQGAARFSGKDDGYIYTRIKNPTTKAFEDNVAALENGYGGLATSTGMSALSTLLMALLDQDAHLIGTDAVYGPSRLLVETFFSKFGVTYDYVDTSHIQNIEGCLRPNTKVLFIETPANPTMAITDIQACAELAHTHELILMVDNTFASPLLQNPLDLGADIVYHSVTKFINGYSDICGGIIVPKSKELFDKIYKSLVYMGGTMDPHQSWLALRGVKSLALRVEKSQETAHKLARFLQDHPKVAWVNYPGLESHEQHELAKKQMKGFGSLLCFGLKGGFAAGEKFINSVTIAALAVSLGGIESLIQHPASMTHAGVPQEKRMAAGITEDLVRLSVGCESYADLKQDLEQALDQTDV